jgi:hypothetical protein
VLAAADDKGAARNYVLDTREHDGTHYEIVAFSVGEGLSQEQLDRLTRQATLVPLGTVRFEGMMAAELPEAFASNTEANSINQLSDPSEGVFVLPITKSSKKSVYSWTVWAVQDGQFYARPLEDKKLPF